MKFAVVLMSLIVSSSAFATSCLIPATNQKFETYTDRVSGEYKVYESATNQKLVFNLAAGHGVARLEAFGKVAGKLKLIAVTFYQTGRDPAQTDSLNLQVRTADGKYVEVFCTEVDKTIAEAK